MKTILFTFLLFLSFGLSASEVTFYSPHAVISDRVQKEMIAKSIIALVEDCSVATKIKNKDIVSNGQGIEVIYSIPIELNHRPVGRVKNIYKVVVRLGDKAEKNYNMYIYAFTKTDVYLLGKYNRLAYPIISMIKRPIPPNEPI